MTAIRPAERRDLAALAALEAEIFASPWTEAQLSGYLEPGKHLFLVAEEGDRIIGYVNAMTVLDEGYIGNVAVTPGHRRQGVGDALLAALTALGRERGLAFLTLEVRESNLPARRLYEKHGFRPAGRRRGYYSRPREDAILMTLEFEHI